MLDLTAPGALALAADQIKAQIDEAGELPARFSWRIKPSSLGGECVARIWYAWRWASKRTTPGRLARTFDRGNEAEARMCAYIRKAGWVIMDEDPERLHLKKKQYKAKALNKHLASFIDGLCYHEEHTAFMFWLLELKTMSRGRFNQLIAKRSVQQKENQYYTQLQIYMHLMQKPYCLFVAECTEDQEIYTEVIPYNAEVALRALELGTIVMTSNIRPARVAETPAFGVCKSCEHLPVCHLGARAEKNCRSCLHIEAIDGGQFKCNKWNATIPGEAEMLQGCPEHEGIK
jgi:hypothetical protein